MSPRKRRLLAWLTGLSALAVVVWLAMRSVEAEPDIDQRSYEKGYHAFGGAWLSPSDEERAASEARCEELWGAFPSDELAGLNKDDWVDGCADYVEGRDSRF
ncbi:hypothetical protein ACLGIH_19795 [Streptomyces sp. HMX87]|uniref:hypothetical protein n=1 Tax=Streptomyces sp. HMX87 TaxID=3390849 RepID=UPI003A86E2F4